MSQNAGMTQIRVYARDSWLPAARPQLSAAIQAAVVEALDYPPDKWVHRFFPMTAENFVWGFERSERYTLIEISMFAGRSVAAKKALLALLFRNIEAAVGVLPRDVEITICETPRENWGIRGVPGDELALDYIVDV